MPVGRVQSWRIDYAAAPVVEICRLPTCLNVFRLARRGTKVVDLRVEVNWFLAGKTIFHLFFSLK